MRELMSVNPCKAIPGEGTQSTMRRYEELFTNWQQTPRDEFATESAMDAVTASRIAPPISEAML